MCFSLLSAAIVMMMIIVVIVVISFYAHNSLLSRAIVVPKSPSSVHKNSARVVIQFNDNQIFSHVIISPTTQLFQWQGTTMLLEQCASDHVQFVSTPATEKFWFSRLLTHPTIADFVKFLCAYFVILFSLNKYFKSINCATQHFASFKHLLCRL